LFLYTRATTNPSVNLNEVDFEQARMISIGDRSITVILEGDTELIFKFHTGEDLRKAMQEWLVERKPTSAQIASFNISQFTLPPGPPIQ
jgi:hypothetical protein